MPKLNLSELEDLAQEAEYRVEPTNCPENCSCITNLQYKIFTAFPSILQTLKAYEEVIERVRDMEINDDDTEFEQFKIVASMQNTRWRSQRDTILQDLDKKLSDITL